MRQIRTNMAPEAIGPYSQAVEHGGVVYLSGQIPLDPKSMQLCSEEIREQIFQVFHNLAAVCEAAGGNLSQLVKLTIYLKDLTHFPLVNEAMTHFFTKPYPARAAIGVADLPIGSKVEVEAIMALSKD